MWEHFLEASKISACGFKGEGGLMNIFHNGPGFDPLFPGLRLAFSKLVISFTLEFIVLELELQVSLFGGFYSAFLTACHTRYPFTPQDNFSP